MCSSTHAPSLLILNCRKVKSLLGFTYLSTRACYTYLRHCLNLLVVFIMVIPCCLSVCTRMYAYTRCLTHGTCRSDQSYHMCYQEYTEFNVGYCSLRKSVCDTLIVRIDNCLSSKKTVLSTSIKAEVIVIVSAEFIIL